MNQLQHHQQQPLKGVVYCKRADGRASAKGRLFGDRVFQVLKGSTAIGQPNPVFHSILVKKGILVKDKKSAIYVFAEDYTFRGPSPAASTVLGYKVNGWETWKNKDRQSLNQLKKRE